MLQEKFFQISKGPFSGISSMVWFRCLELLERLWGTDSWDGVMYVTFPGVSANDCRHLLKLNPEESTAEWLWSVLPRQLAWRRVLNPYNLVRKEAVFKLCVTKKLSLQSFLSYEYLSRNLGSNCCEIELLVQRYTVPVSSLRACRSARSWTFAAGIGSPCNTIWCSHLLIVWRISIVGGGVYFDDLLPMWPRWLDNRSSSTRASSSMCCSV